MLARLICLTAMSLVLSSAMASDGTDAQTEKNAPGKARNSQASLYLENDLFSSALRLGKSDKYYTNGVKLSYAFDSKSAWAHTKAMKGAMDETKEYLPFQIGNLRYGVVVAQLMYTPKNIATTEPQPNDRYYGGWLYLGSVIQNTIEKPVDADRQTGVITRTQTAELDIGMVGPYSFAGQTQKLIHGMFHYTTPGGWKYELKSEPGIQFSYNDIIKFRSGPHMDASCYFGGTAGTIFDNVRGGIILRAGKNMEGMPASTIETPVIGAKLRKNGWYFLLRGEIQGVLHNTFIDGSLLQPPPFQSNIKSKPVVGQLTGGLILEGIHGTKISFLINRRTQEFTSPTIGKSPLFTFGTVNVEWPLGNE